MAESILQPVVFVLAGIAALVTLSLPALAIDWWDATRRDDESDDS